MAAAGTPPRTPREGARKDAPPVPAGPPPATPKRRFHLSWRWVVFGLVVLGLNLFLSSRAMEPASRVRVPYSPFFLNQVKAGHVMEITSKGTAVQGTFDKELTYGNSKPTTRFKTEIPAFADNDALSAVLVEKGVVVNAEPLDTGLPWWQSLLLGFGPTILLIGL